MSHVFRLSLTALIVGLVTAVAAQAPPPQGGRGGGPQMQLPDGPGKEAVQAACTSCHATALINTSAGYSRDGWQHVIESMVELPDAQEAAITQYLATHFPEKPGRRPTLVSGPVQVNFREWVVPTLGQRSRDPIQLKDGTIWWTGQYGSLVGRLNPRTGEMQEYELPRQARPHSITADRDGNIWYTGNGNGTLGKINAATGDISVYPMPDPAARDPHTLIFDRNGMLWFTLQQSNMVGRMNPASGEIKLVTMPTPNSRPYGIQINSQGVPWVSTYGISKLVSLDPQTMAVREHPLPNPDARSRRLAIASDDTVYYVDSERGYLGRMNPRTGEVKEWPSPSGAGSHPYAIAIIDDIVWYNESGQRPDALVRFDPATERFQSWAIPSGVGIIRHMTVSPEKNLVIHQSSINRIGLVEIGRQTERSSASTAR